MGSSKAAVRFNVEFIGRYCSLVTAQLVKSPGRHLASTSRGSHFRHPQARAVERLQSNGSVVLASAKHRDEYAFRRLLERVVYSK